MPLRRHERPSQPHISLRTPSARTRLRAEHLGLASRKLTGCAVGETLRRGQLSSVSHGACIPGEPQTLTGNRDFASLRRRRQLRVRIEAACVFLAIAAVLFTALTEWPLLWLVEALS